MSSALPCCAILLLLVAAPRVMGGDGSGPLELHSVNATDPSAVCLDGSPGIFFLRRGASNSTGWILNFAGGGWCYSKADCWRRSKGFLGSSKNVSASGIAGLELAASPFTAVSSDDCHKNPVFCDYNQVYLYYCDGDSFSGNRDDPINVNGDLVYFRGHRILSAVLDMLLSDFGMASSSHVLLTGCSAGGLSTLLHSDYVGQTLRARAPSLVSYKVLPESSIFPVSIPNVAGQSVFSAQMKEAFSVHNASSGVHQGCLEFAAEPWMCNTAEGIYPHVQAPVMLMQSLYDAWSTACIFGAGAVSPSSAHNGNCSTFPEWTDCLGGTGDINFPGGDQGDRAPAQCSSSEVSTLNKLWRAPLLRLLQGASTFAAAGNGVFLHACYIHCASVYDNLMGPGCHDCWNKLKVHNTSQQEAVLRWWQSAPSTPAATNTYTDCAWSPDSEQHQCNPTCGTRR